MKIKKSWIKKYELLLQEDLTQKDIMYIFDCNYNTAKKIKYKALKDSFSNNIEYFGNKIPTESVISVTGKQLRYFYDKMLQEIQFNKLLEKEI